MTGPRCDNGDLVTHQISRIYHLHSASLNISNTSAWVQIVVSMNRFSSATGVFGCSATFVAGRRIFAVLKAASVLLYFV